MGSKAKVVKKAISKTSKVKLDMKKMREKIKQMPALEEKKLEKSPGDLNEYHFFTLENKIEVLLVQDNN